MARGELDVSFWSLCPTIIIDVMISGLGKSNFLKKLMGDSANAEGNSVTKTKMTLLARTLRRSIYLFTWKILQLSELTAL